MLAATFYLFERSIAFISSASNCLRIAFLELKKNLRRKKNSQRRWILFESLISYAYDTIFIYFVYLFLLESKEICQRISFRIISNNLKKKKMIFVLNFLFNCSIETCLYYYRANLNLVSEYGEAVHQLLFSAWNNLRNLIALSLLWLPASIQIHSYIRIANKKIKISFHDKGFHVSKNLFWKIFFLFQ